MLKKPPLHLLDKATVLTLAARGWNILIGPVSLTIVATRLSPNEQGVYYAFASLLGLNIFLEMGLSQSVMTFISQEAGRLESNGAKRISGNPMAADRVLGFVKASLILYLIAALASVVLVGAVGAYILQRGDISGIDWKWPWFNLVCVSALQLLCNPLFIMIEALGCVAEVVQERFFRQIITGLSLIGLLLCGFKLHAVALATFAGLALFAARLFRERIGLLGQIWCGSSSLGFKLMKELAEYQIKIGLSWICGYLIFNFYVPMVYLLLGPVQAGKFGMSWNVMSMIITTGAGLIALKLPTAGQMIGAHEYGKARQEIGKGVVGGLWICAAGGALAIGGLSLAPMLGRITGYEFFTRIPERMIPALSLGWFTLGGFAYIYTNGIVSYVRAHKLEPFVPFSVAMLVLTLAGTLAGAQVSLNYICVSYCIIQWLLLPYASYLEKKSIAGMPGSSAWAH